MISDLEVVYLALEDGEVLRDMGDSWSEDDDLEFGLSFEQLLELREYVLDQDYSNNLGFRLLLESLFPQNLRELLSEDELEIWNSVESSLDPTIFSLGMGNLISGDYRSLKETVIDDFLLEELDGMPSANQLKKLIRDHFREWAKTDEPKILAGSLPVLASKEISKLESLRA